MRLARYVLGVAAFLAGQANAQTYVATQASAAYPALTTPAPVALAGSAPLDNGRAAVPLGFTFTFYGKAYDELVVTANGVAFFEPTACATCDYPGNAALPSGGLPNGVIAPLWDDLKGGNPQSKLQQEALAGPNGAGLAIEWRDWNAWSASATYSLTFQVRLWENGVIEFFYGPMTGAGPALSASAGLEDPTGTKGVAAFPCSNQPYAYCALADFPSGKSVTFGPPALPNLVAVSLAVSQVVQAGSDLVVTTDLVARNWGQAAANGFSYRLFLSANTTYEPALDVALAPAAEGPFTLGPMATLAHQAVSTVPLPAAGSYYVIAVLDAAGAVAESDETDNVAATYAPPRPGEDLVAESITGPATAGPGELLAPHLVLANQGLDAAGTTSVKVWLSADADLGAGDLLVYSGAETVAGGATLSRDPSFALPASVPKGAYLLVLQLDDGPAAGAIAELSETNNVAFSSAQVMVEQADLAVGPVEVRDALPPNGLSASAFFGVDARVEATVSNVGGATAAGAAVVFYLSDNAVLNAASDPEIGFVGGLTLGPGESTLVHLVAPVPASGMSGASFAPGLFYVFAVAVPAAGAAEANPSNDVNRSAAQRVRAPAADLVPASVVGPDKAGQGELIAVTRRVRNAGNLAASQVRYRYVLTVNPAVTELDPVLLIETASGLADEGRVTLAAGAEDSATELVRVPSGTPPATYYLGLLVNPPGAGQVDEISFDDDGLASQEITIEAQALEVSNLSLPDARAGVPYETRLTGRGGTGGYTFAADPAVEPLPAELMLDSDGRLSGTPVDPGVVAFSVTVSSGSRSASARLVLRIVPFTSELAVATRRLAPLARSVPYEDFFSALGGTWPYSWRVASGQLPPGLALDAAGRLAGVTPAAAGTTATFVAQVIDGSGATASFEASMTVLEASGLEVVTPGIALAAVGESFALDVVARNADQSPLAPPVEWSLARGPLPPGLELSFAGEVALILGTPVAAGVFPLRLEVHDGSGRAQEGAFVLTVEAGVASLRTDLPAELLRGQAVEAAALVSGAPPATARLYGGRLPPGLALASDGAISGTVDPGAGLGPYSFTVTAVAPDGARAVAVFRTAVVESITPRPASCGCGSTGGSGVIALGVALALTYRRKGFSRGAKGPNNTEPLLIWPR